eukprot:IDg3235t1
MRSTATAATLLRTKIEAVEIDPTGSCACRMAIVVVERSSWGQLILVVRVGTVTYPSRVTPTSADRQESQARTALHAVYPRVAWLDLQDGNELRLQYAATQGQRASKSQTKATKLTVSRRLRLIYSFSFPRANPGIS